MKGRLDAGFIKPHRQEIAKAIISQIGAKSNVPAAVSHAKALGVMSLLASLGVIERAPTSATPFGFITSLGGKGRVFYRPRAVRGAAAFGLRAGALVEISVKPSTRKAGQFIADSVRPVRAMDLRDGPLEEPSDDKKE